jgi:hypothetical protein
MHGPLAPIGYLFFKDITNIKGKNRSNVFEENWKNPIARRLGKPLGGQVMR